MAAECSREGLFLSKLRRLWNMRIETRAVVCRHFLLVWLIRLAVIVLDRKICLLVEIDLQIS